MCWETSLTKCYPLRNNRATITGIIVLGLTLGLGPGRDAKLIFTNGGSYIQHLQLPLRLSTTTVQYQIWNGPNALFNWDIFWHFLQFSCKWCSFGSQQTAASSMDGTYDQLELECSGAMLVMPWSYFRFRECRENGNDQFDYLPAIKMPSGGKNTSFSSTAVECTFVW